MCKCCKQSMEFVSERPYRPNNGLNAINHKTDISNSEFVKISKPTITCPYCHSTNTKKISGLSKAGSIALFGIFAMGKVSKQWHCNNCGSDF